MWIGFGPRVVEIDVVTIDETNIDYYYKAEAGETMVEVTEGCDQYFGYVGTSADVIAKLEEAIAYIKAHDVTS